MAHRVLLTGGNGFIGSHILANLLNRGFIVRCTVRSASKGNKILQDFSSQKPQIDIAIIPDIVVTGAYDDAVKSNPPFDSVIHTASPFLYSATQSNLEFLDPAIKGTVNLLQAVNKNAPSVKRVVVTSSGASVVDYSHLTSNPVKVYTEADWNPLTWNEAVHGDPSKAYRASKKFAEQAAWKFVAEEAPNFDLVTLCPPATFGPLKHSITSIKDLNESNARFWKLCCQSSKDSPMPYMPVHTYTDVRDLATAFVQAILVPEAGNNRFLVCARQFSFQEVCDILRAHFPELDERVPLGKPGISSLPEGAYTFDNFKVRNLLGVKFRPLEKTIVELTGHLLAVEKAENQANNGE